MQRLVKRLQHYVTLDDQEVADLYALPMRSAKFARGSELVVAGQPMQRAFVVRSGWAVRFHLLEDGRRQVLNILLPGDIFDLQVFVAAEADHNVIAVTDMDVDLVDVDDFARLFYRGGRLSLAFWWSAVQEEAMLREQIVRNGRRTGAERVAHFLLELHRRALIVGEAEGNSFQLPLTQSLIADALGLTNVYVSRIIAAMVRRQLIARNRESLTLLDPQQLVAIAQYDPSYLHLDAYSRRFARSLRG